MSDKKDRPEAPARKRAPPAERGWSSWSLEKKFTVVIVPLTVALISAGPAVIGALVGDEKGATPSNGSSSSAPTEPSKREIPRFNGVVGNFAEARAFVSFLENNDGDPVQLEEVGFNEATFDDFITETIEVDGKDVLQVSYVQVWTECTPDIPEDTDPEFGMGCLATSFQIDGQDTDDAQAYLTHGVPVYDGFFRVDVSGILQNGVSPIFLEPLTARRQQRANPDLSLLDG